MVRGMNQFRKLIFSVSTMMVLTTSACTAKDGEVKKDAATPAPAATASTPSPEAPAYKVNGKTFTVSDVATKEQSAFFDLEKKKYDLISEAARVEFLNQFWQELSAKKKTSLDKTKENYVKERVKVSEAEVKELLEKLKDHPQLSKLSPEDRKKQINDYLIGRDSQKVVEDIIAEGIKDGKLEILYAKPQEPVYELKVVDGEPVRYGPKATDVKPLGCKGNDCPITVIEYSEFECPYCSRMIADTSKVLEEYKGKIRWYVRDFPLEFHARARPAAIAAKCALFQNKYWEMYYAIFEDQKDLTDEGLTKKAETIKLDMKKFAECYKTPNNLNVDSAWKRADNLIRENFESGRKNGVEGTPAFFINGRKLSGALPFAEFKRVIDEELAKKKAS